MRSFRNDSYLDKANGGFGRREVLQQFAHCGQVMDLHAVIWVTPTADFHAGGVPRIPTTLLTSGKGQTN
jgi:hypothetical protein